MRISCAIVTLAACIGTVLVEARIVRADCPADKQYTTAAQFADEFWVNLNTNGAQELVVNEDPEPLKYIWVAVSARGTIVRIDTETGVVLGEYRSAPEGRGGDPSRTTVDLFGNVWAGNRAEYSSN